MGGTDRYGVASNRCAAGIHRGHKRNARLGIACGCDRAGRSTRYNGIDSETPADLRGRQMGGIARLVCINRASACRHKGQCATRGDGADTRRCGGERDNVTTACRGTGRQCGRSPKVLRPGIGEGDGLGQAGVTELDAAEALPVPALFVAVTVNV